MKKKRYAAHAAALLSALLSLQPALSTMSLQAVSESMPVIQEEQTILHAADFGADPAGIKDSTEAVISLLEKARELRETTGKPVRVEFDQGTYQIYKDRASKRIIHTSNTNSSDYPEKTIGILIENQQDLTIDGHGSLFMMHGNMMALCVSHSSNIVLENFSWDFEVPTTSEMTIASFGQEGNSQTTTFYIPKCFPYEISGTSLRWHSELSPYTGSEYWSQTGIHSSAYCISAHDPWAEVTRRYNTTTDSPFCNVSSIEPVEGSDGTMVRFVYSGSRPAMQKVGMVLELNASGTRETAGAMIWESENVTCRNVSIHYMHGFGFLLQMSRDLYFYDCKMKPRKNSGHITSSYADGLHASGVAGDLVIEGCEFIGLHDDPINIHGTFTRAENVIDSHTLQLNYIHRQQGGFPQFHAGDKVQFFSRDTLESSDHEKAYTVSEVVSNPGENGNNLKTMVIRFEEELPDYLSEKIGSEPKYVAENITYTPDVTIRNNTFRDLAARAVLCTSRGHVLIEDNDFYNTSMATIYLSNDSDNWYESGPIRDMTIRQNTFHIKDSGERSWQYRSAIYVNPVTKNGGLPSWNNPVHKNITVEDNTFFMDSDTVVKAESTENLIVRNNSVIRTNPDIVFENVPEIITLQTGENRALSVLASGRQRTGTTENVYELTACKSVTFEHNTYDDGQKLYAVYSSMPSDQIQILNDAVSLSTEKAGAASAGAGEVFAISSNPEILSVLPDGSLRANQAGETAVRFCTKWNDTILESNPVLVLVSASAQSVDKPVIGFSGSLYLEKDESAKLDSLSGQGDWSISNPDGSSCDQCAAVSPEGLVTFAKSGIYKVTLSNAAGSDSLLIACSTGSDSGLNSALNIYNEDSSTLALEANRADIALQKGDLHQNNNGVKNLIQYSLAESVDPQNFKTVIHAGNLPTAESEQWDTASFALMTDPDNYITIGKKSHFSGFSSVSETNASATETGGSAEHNAVTDAWLGFTRSGNTVSLDFSLDGSTWQHLRNLDGSMLSDSLKIAFGGWHTNDRSKHVVFSDLKVSSSAADYAALMQEDSIPFLITNHQAPEIVSAALHQDADGKTVSVQTQTRCADQAQIVKSWYRFALEKPDGEVQSWISDKPDWSINAGGILNCTVYVQDSFGTPARPAAADSMPVSLQDADPHLVSASVSSIPVDISTEATQKILLPHGLQQAELFADSQNAPCTVNGKAVENGRAVVDLDSDSVPVEIICGKDTLHLELVVSKDCSCEIDQLRINGQDPQEQTLIPADQKTAQLSMSSDASSSMRIWKDTSTVPVEVQPAARQHEALLELENGLNNFRIECLAENGLSSTSRIVSLFYIPDSSIELKSIQADDTALDLNAPDVILESGKDSCVLKAEVSDGCALIWDFEGRQISSAEAVIDSLKPGRNEVRLIVTAEDGVSRLSRTISIYVLEESDCALMRLSAEGRSFDLNADRYEEMTDQDSITVSARSADPHALVILSSSSMQKAGFGEVTADISLYEQSDTITVTVISQDGRKSSSKEIHLEKGTWLSSLDWLSSSYTGYDVLRKDLSGVGNPMQLLDENGKEVSFQKGIGTHANASVRYSLPEGVYTFLEGYVGVDAAKKNSEYANIVFTINGDGDELFASGVMEGSTPMKAFSLSLDGISDLELKALQSENSNWDAHGDFAWMKLGMKFAAANDSLNTEKLKSELSKTDHIDFPALDPEKVQEWMDALNAGGVLLGQAADSDSITQEQIDQAASEIEKTRTLMMNSSDTELDRSLLEAALTKAESINLNLFEQTGQDSFIQQLNQAKSVLESSEDQTEIDQAAVQLSRALQTLRRKPDDSSLTDL